MSYVISAFADEASPDLKEQIRICSVAGVGHIEMRGVNGKNISDLSAGEAAEIKKQLAAAGIGVSAAGSPFGKIGIDDDFAPHLEKFKRTVEVSHILGTSLMRIFSFYIPGGEEPSRYKSAVVERLGELIGAADGIKLCHENESDIFGESPERCRELFDEFGGKLALVFDPANFVYRGYDVESAYELLEEGIEYFHIKDCVGANKKIVPAGRGDGKIGWILGRFEKKNGDTFVSVEPHLKIFEGFAGLEKEAKRTFKDEFEYDTNEQAFVAAVTALKNILNPA